MPYENVQEKVVRTKRVRVCARCRSRLPETGGDRQTMNTVGGVSGSLGASLGGSMLLGSVLGPVGAIGGAIAGSIAGARAGRNASNKLADAVESRDTADDLCESCRSIGTYNNRGGGQALGGGNRLGSGEPVQQKSLNSNATPGEKIGEAASAAGRGINNGLSWMKQSVTNVIDNAKNSNSNSNHNKNSGDPPPPGWGGSSSGNQTSGVL